MLPVIVRDVAPNFQGVATKGDFVVSSVVAQRGGTNFSLSPFSLNSSIMLLRGHLVAPLWRT